MKKGWFVSDPRTNGFPTLLTDNPRKAKRRRKKIKSANYFKAWLDETNGRDYWLPR